MNISLRGLITVDKTNDLERYRRQNLLSFFPQDKQKVLAKTEVLIVGGGGLGSNSASHLVRLGVGSLKIVDSDVVELSNLHRTNVFDEGDVGRKKSEVLEQKLSQINSQTKVVGVSERVTAENIEDLVKGADVIMDGTDNLLTRFLINEVSIKHNVPWVYAGVHGVVGMVFGVIPQKTPCLQCMMETLPSQQPKVELPVLGNLPGVVAGMQCTELLRLVFEKETSGLLIYDLWRHHFEVMTVQRNTKCRCCAVQDYVYL